MKYLSIELGAENTPRPEGNFFLTGAALGGSFQSEIEPVVLLTLSAFELEGFAGVRNRVLP